MKNSVTTILLMLTLVLCGCGKSNDEIISETKKCEAAGMKAVVLINGLDSTVRAIQCQPKQ